MENTNYDISDIKFPIVVFERRNTIFFARVKEEITVCTRTAFKHGFYKDLQIVDSNGFLYKLKGAKKIGTVGLFWGYNIFLSQKLRVELLIVYRSDIAITLEELKSRILVLFKATESFWNSDGSFEKRIAFIEKAASGLEIIERLGDEFYKTN